MDPDNLPDFLQLNGIGVRPGMFAAPRRSPPGAGPFAAIAPPQADPLADALTRLIGQGAPTPSPFSSSPFVPPAPAPRISQCPIVPLDPAPGSIVANNADLRFSPEFADVVRRAAETLNRQGMRLNVNEGFRTAADQWRMRHGGSGKNPAAKYSDHQLGNAIDINGTHLPSFPKVVEAFRQAGANWGANWGDRPHFYIRPVRANAYNTAECERENPR